MGSVLYGISSIWDQFYMGSVLYGISSIWDQFYMGSVLYGIVSQKSDEKRDIKFVLIF